MFLLSLALLVLLVFSGWMVEVCSRYTKTGILTPWDFAIIAFAIIFLASAIGNLIILGLFIWNLFSGNYGHGVQMLAWIMLGIWVIHDIAVLRTVASLRRQGLLNEKK